MRFITAFPGSDGACCDDMVRDDVCDPCSADVGLRLRVYYHEANPASLASDWASLRDYLNAFDLNTLTQGNATTLDPPPVIHSGTYDPGTETHVITGTCPYLVNPGTNAPGFASATMLGRSCALVNRVHDFDSVVDQDHTADFGAATELVMQIGRFRYSSSTSYVERTYEGAVAFGPDITDPTETIFNALTNGPDVGTAGTLLKTTLSDAHNFPSMPFAARIIGGDPFGSIIEDVTVTARTKVGWFTVTRSGTPEDWTAGGAFAVVVHPAYAPSESIGCSVPGTSGGIPGPLVGTENKSGQLITVRVPELDWPAPAAWPPTPPFGYAGCVHVLATAIGHGYVIRATLT